MSEKQTWSFTSESLSDNHGNDSQKHKDKYKEWPTSTGHQTPSNEKKPRATANSIQTTGRELV